MCGISGVYNRKGFDIKELQNITDIVNHRGPNDEGFVVFHQLNEKPTCYGGKDTPISTFNSDLEFHPQSKIEANQSEKAFLGFGHRRLSILDLSSLGHQPQCSSDGRFWLTFNGEIYNYMELKEELNILGHNFISDCDTEVILKAYAEWGIDCQHKFNGMWAFAIYDIDKQELFLSRDRFGIKPLYYWFSPSGSLYFGSEIKQFTSADGWKAEVNPNRVHDYLLYSLIDHTDETMFKGVYQLKPGNCFVSKVDDIKADKYGKLNATTWYRLKPKKFKGSYEEAVKKTRELFIDAVKLHLRSDVPVGSALSGGLDSSSIVCLINQFLKAEGKEELQKTFSSCSEDSKYDEKKWMDEVVKQINVDAHFTYPSLDDLFDLTPKIIFYQDEPYQSNAVYLGYHVFQEAKKNDVIVLMNGNGADEFLGGYIPGYFNSRFINLFRKLKWVALYNDLKAVKEIHGFGYTNFLMSLVAYLAPTPLMKILRKFSSSSNSRPSWLNLDKIGKNFQHPYDILNISSGSVKEMSMHQLFCSHLQKLLHYVDRNSMAHSLEVRVPFLDYRFVEFIMSLPEDYIVNKGVTKRVLRDAMKDILPEKVRNRIDKKGFITPEEKWVRFEQPELFRSKVKEATEGTYGVITKDAINYVDDLINGKIPFDQSYWRIIQFHQWMKINNIQL